MMIEMNEKKERIRINLEKALAGRPHIFRRDKLRELLDGNSAGVLSNLDCKGLGPQNPFCIGRKVAYEVPDYVNWVVGRISPVRENE
jgi:hypothetical protein